MAEFEFKTPMPMPTAMSNTELGQKTVRIPTKIIETFVMASLRADK
jgi:hypothetical protein